MPHLKQEYPDGTKAVYVWFEAMHTRVDILLKSRTASHAFLLEAAEAVRSVIGRLESVGNRFSPQSEISRLCASPEGVPVKISDELFDMLSICQDYNRRTDGLFDITVASKDYDAATVRAVVLCHTDRTCTLMRPGIILDLSGFIKGHALDCIKPMLLGRGISDALVSLGNSSIMAIGDVPGPVKDGFLTTSGNDSAERRHIVDTRTGRLVEGVGVAQLRTESGAEGEVMAKVAFIRGHSGE